MKSRITICIVFSIVFLLGMMPVVQAESYREVKAPVTLNERGADELVDVENRSTSNYNVTWKPFLENNTDIQGSVSHAMLPPSPANFSAVSGETQVATQLASFSHQDVMEGSSVQWWRSPFKVQEDTSIHLQLYRVNSLKQAETSISSTLTSMWHDVSLDWVANEDKVFEKTYDATKNSSTHRRHSLTWRNISYDFSYCRTNAPIYSEGNYLVVWQWQQDIKGNETIYFTQSDAGNNDYYNSSLFLSNTHVKAPDNKKTYDVNILTDLLHEYGQSDKLAGEVISSGPVDHKIGESWYTKSDWNNDNATHTNTVSLTEDGILMVEEGKPSGTWQSEPIDLGDRGYYYSSFVEFDTKFGNLESGDDPDDYLQLFFKLESWSSWEKIQSNQELPNLDRTTNITGENVFFKAEFGNQDEECKEPALVNLEFEMTIYEEIEGYSEGDDVPVAEWQSELDSQISYNERRGNHSLIIQLGMGWEEGKYDVTLKNAFINGTGVSSENKQKYIENVSMNQVLPIAEFGSGSNQGNITNDHTQIGDNYTLYAPSLNTTIPESDYTLYRGDGYISIDEEAYWTDYMGFVLVYNTTDSNAFSFTLPVDSDGRIKDEWDENSDWEEYAVKDEEIEIKNDELNYTGTSDGGFRRWRSEWIYLGKIDNYFNSSVEFNRIQTPESTISVLFKLSSYDSFKVLNNGESLHDATSELSVGDDLSKESIQFQISMQKDVDDTYPRVSNLKFHIDNNLSIGYDIEFFKNNWTGGESLYDEVKYIHGAKDYIMVSEWVMDFFEEGTTFDRAYITIYKKYSQTQDIGFWMEDRNDIEEEYQYTYSKVRSKEDAQRLRMSGYVPFHTFQSHGFRIENVRPPSIPINALLPPEQYELKSESQPNLIEGVWNTVKWMSPVYVNYRIFKDVVLPNLRKAGQFALTETPIGGIVSFLDDTVGDAIRWVGMQFKEIVTFIVENFEWLVFSFFRIIALVGSLGMFLGTIWMGSKFINYWYLVATENLNRANNYIKEEGRSIVALLILIAVTMFNVIQIVTGPLT